MLRLCRQRHVDRHRLLVHLLHLLRLLVHLLREEGVGSRRAHRRLRQQLLVVRRSPLRVARGTPRVVLHRASARCLMGVFYILYIYMYLLCADRDR